MRVKFERGKQRKFIKKVLGIIACPSLRSLSERGFDLPYSTLKNYYSEARFLPEEFFNNLCTIAKIDKSKLRITLLKENWGQRKKRKSFNISPKLFF